MKKTLSILMLLVAFLMPGALRAQGTLTVCNGTDSNEYVPIYGYYADDEQTSQMIFPSSMLTAMQGYAIEQMVFYVASDGGLDADLGDWDVSLGITSATMLNGLDNSTALTQVYSGPMIFDDNINASMMIVSFTTPFVYNGGNLLVEFDHPVSADYNHYYFYGVTAASASYSWDSSFNFLPKTTFSYASCSRPASLTINNVTTTTAAISWTGNASSYEYEVLSANGGPVVSGTTANNYIFVPGLTTYTQYIVSVRAFCSATDTSAWAVTDFRTAMCDDACPITIVMHDSYGDGWGDCSLSIVDSLTADTIANITLASDSLETVQLPLCNGRDYIVYWNSASWNSETSYEIYALDGSLIDSASDPAEGRHLAFTHVCPTVNPDSVIVYLSVNDDDMGTTTPAPGSYSFALGDTATATAIPYEGFRFVNWTITAMGQVFTLTDNPLSQEVTSMFAGMTVSVMANFDEEELSDSVTVTILVNHPEMGTTRPAPGTYTYALGDSVSFYAVPSDDNHFFVNWTVIFSGFPFPMPMAENPLVAYMDELSAGGSYTIIANFTDDTNNIPTGAIVNLSVNDTTMGYTDPGAGRYEYAVGENISITAYPYEGYEFVGWYTEIFGEGDTVYMNPLVSDEPVDDYMVGWEINVTAIFAPSTAIRDIEVSDVNVISDAGAIVVRGAEGERLAIYDVMGRCLQSVDAIRTEHRFRPVTAGVYLVKVGDHPARRVLVR